MRKLCAQTKVVPVTHPGRGGVGGSSSITSTELAVDADLRDAGRHGQVRWHHRTDRGLAGGRAAPGARRDRPQRCGQDHAVQRGLRLRPPDTGDAPLAGRRAAPAPPARAGRARDRPHPPGLRSVRPDHGARERHGRRGPARRSRLPGPPCSAAALGPGGAGAARAGAAVLDELGIEAYAARYPREPAVRRPQEGGPGPRPGRRARAAAARRAGQRAVVRRDGRDRRCSAASPTG